MVSSPSKQHSSNNDLQKSLLAENGHLTIKKLLDPDSFLFRQAVIAADEQWSSTIKAANDSDDLLLTGGTTKTMRFGFTTQTSDEPIFQLATFKPLLLRILELTGWSSIVPLHYYLFYKSAEGPFTPWHQDNAYLPVDRKALTVWLPLIKLPSPNGMVFANGSQNLSINWQEIEEEGLHNYFTNRDCNFDHVTDLDPGDADLHDGYVVHCGTKNFLRTTRRVLAIAFLDGDSKFSKNYIGSNLDPTNGDLAMRDQLASHYFSTISDGSFVKEALPHFTRDELKFQNKV